MLVVERAGIAMSTHSYEFRPFFYIFDSMTSKCNMILYVRDTETGVLQKYESTQCGDFWGMLEEMKPYGYLHVSSSDWTVSDKARVLVGMSSIHIQFLDFVDDIKLVSLRHDHPLSKRWEKRGSGLMGVKFEALDQEFYSVFRGKTVIAPEKQCFNLLDTCWMCNDCWYNDAFYIPRGSFYTRVDDEDNLKLRNQAYKIAFTDIAETKAFLGKVVLMRGQRGMT